MFPSTIALLRGPRIAFGVISLLAGLTRPSLSQGAIQGAVTAASSGAPLADVNVLVAELRRRVITDGQGRYRITGVPAGTYRVVTQHVGFASDTTPATVVAGGIVTVDVRLRAAATIVAPVTVSATAQVQRRSEGSVTIDATSGEDLQATRPSHPAEILNRLSGVHVRPTSGEGHMMAIRLPITTNPMYVYLEDGIPTRATGFFNHNALYEVNIPQAAGIEVIKGPGTALYGSDAIGGVVNVLTRPAPLTPTLETSVETGVHGYRRLLATGGGTWGSNGVRADLNLTHSDNWLQQSPFSRQSGTLRWDAVIGSSGWTAKTLLTGSRINQVDVPAVSAAVFDTATTVNLAPIAFRRVRALRVSTAFERQGVAGAPSWSITPYARVNDMGLLPSWQLTYDPQVWDTKNNSLGVVARWRRDVAPWHGQVILGTDGDYSPGSFRANKVIYTRTGSYRAYTEYTEGETQYDYDVTYRALSPYVQTQWAPASRLHVDAGVRADFAGYGYTTRLSPVDTGTHRRPANTSVSYTHLSPKIGLSADVAPQTSVFASYRNGFRAPSQGQLFQQNSALNTVGLKPVEVDSYEAGIRGQVGARLVYQVSAYDMTIRDDILTFVTSSNTREASNAGRTRHRGVEASTGAAVTPTLRVDVAYSLSSRRYVDWTPSASSTSAASYTGNLVEQAPRDLSDLLLTWSPPALRGGRVTADWNHVGRYVEDAANTKAYPGYELVNLQANAFLQPRVEVFARAVNLLDRHYAELVTYDAFQKDTYNPGAPRQAYAGVRYRW